MMTRPARRLHLLRHAKSAWDNPALSDFERPLDPRGERAAAAMAVYARQIEMAPDVVLCSSARRTRETWARLAAELPTPRDVQFVDAIYEAGPRTLLDLVRSLPDAAGAALLIGHNPGLMSTALALADGPAALIDQMAEKYPTCALASFGFEGNWSDLAEGAAELEGFVSPKMLL